jgi:hypothetical protein
VLYAFTHEERILYIGKTTRSIRKRFAGYCRPGKSQQTNIRCHEKIKESLRNNLPIRIFIFNPISQLKYDDFKIDLAAGLEDSLIESFIPDWNIRGSRPVTEDEAREVDEENRNGGGSPAPLSKEPLFVDDIGFNITLKDTYYNNGIINPGKAMNEYLGNNGDPITIYLGNKDVVVSSRINRTANPSGAVRIVGNNGQIAQWFQNNFSLGDTVIAKIINPHSIFLEATPYK